MWAPIGLADKIGNIVGTVSVFLSNDKVAPRGLVRPVQVVANKPPTIVTDPI